MLTIVILAPNKELTMELEDGSTTLITIAGGILEVTQPQSHYW